MGTGRRCAYCDATGDLTNEHVVPDFYHNVFGETISIVKTHSEEKAISNPQEIGDVCANCNNVALSRLERVSKTSPERNPEAGEIEEGAIGGK